MSYSTDRVEDKRSCGDRKGGVATMHVRLTDVYRQLTLYCIANVKNTMSDRHVVQKNFIELLEDYRKEVFPSVVGGWSQISEDERTSLSKLNIFFCGMHFMVGLTDSASASCLVVKTLGVTVVFEIT